MKIRIGLKIPQIQRIDPCNPAKPPNTETPTLIPKNPATPLIERTRRIYHPNQKVAGHLNKQNQMHSSPCSTPPVSVASNPQRGRQIPVPSG